MNYSNYAKNMENYNALNLTSLSQIKDENEFIEKLVAISMQKRVLQQDNNRILSDTLFHYTAHPEEVTYELSEEFRDFYATIQYRVKEILTYHDRSLSLKICELLLDYYYRHDDVNGIARQMLLLYYFNMMHIEHSCIYSDLKTYPQFAHAIDQFDTISSEARVQVIAYLGASVFNPVSMGAALFRYRDYRNFLAVHPLSDSERDHLQVKNAEYFALIDSIAQTSDWLLEGHKLTDDHKVVLRKVHDALQLRIANSEGSYQYPRAYLVVQEASFLLGYITLDELLHRLREKALNGVSTYSNDANAYLMLYSARFIDYLWNYSTDSEDVKTERTERIIKRVVDNLHEYGVSEDAFYAMTDAVVFITTSAKHLGFERMKDNVLKMTVLANKALYIHTLMVNRIGVVLLKEILRIHPEFLVGVAGYSLDYIENNPTELLSLWDQCAMFHDIGKHFCIDFVSNSSRNLFDEEFAMIKYHPQNFEAFFSKSSGPRFDCIHDCALYHHVWHNGKGGYPTVDVYETPNRPFVDILSIADSIDAATDRIGRPYAPDKTLDSLIEEFDTFRDTRYCSAVIDVLKQPEIAEQIRHIILEERKHINYMVYHEKK